MRYRLSSIWILAMACLLVAVVPIAVADDGTSDAGSPGVELVSATLHQTVAGDSTRIETVEVFRNRGEATTIRLPFGAPLIQRPGAPWQGLFRSVRSFVDGRAIRPHTPPVISSVFPGGEFMLWHLEPVTFAAHQTRIVRDVYRGDWVQIVRQSARLVGSGTRGGDMDFGVELFTGRSWSGPIGTCDIVLSLEMLGEDDEITEVLPTAASHEGHEWRWHFEGKLPDSPALPMVAIFWRPRSPAVGH